MVNQTYLLSARDWLIRVVIRLWLWVRRADTIACRDCGLEVQVEMLSFFIETGCLQCGSTRLKMERS